MEAMRVLIVEDDLRMATALRRALHGDGIVADVIGTGDEAICVARANAFDALVLDVMLPGLDGFETCRKLRAEGVWTPVIMLTARDAARIGSAVSTTARTTT